MTHVFDANCQKILAAMKTMHMKKCEKGGITNTRQFKSLSGRWFGEEKKEIMGE